MAISSFHMTRHSKPQPIIVVSTASKVQTSSDNSASPGRTLYKALAQSRPRLAQSCLTSPSFTRRHRAHTRPSSGFCVLCIDGLTSDADPVLARASIRAYGKSRQLDFYLVFPHHSLKIPPKKRRRFPKSFGPLPHGGFSVKAYNYPEGLGKALYREQFDFNAEPPWQPS